MDQVSCLKFFISISGSGYVRVVLNLSAFFVMLHKPYLTVALHFAGGLFLDVVDGVTARYFNQCR